MLIAMAQVIVSEGLHDQAFLRPPSCWASTRRTCRRRRPGASYRSYLLAYRDGVVKTPEWAEPLTGMPAATIRRLGASSSPRIKPARCSCGYAPGRTAYGEQFHRAAYALAAITGNIGIPGGNSGVSNGATGRTGIKRLPRRHQSRPTRGWPRTAPG